MHCLNIITQLCIEPLPNIQSDHCHNMTRKYYFLSHYGSLLLFNVLFVQLILGILYSYLKDMELFWFSIHCFFLLVESKSRYQLQRNVRYLDRQLPSVITSLFALPLLLTTPMLRSKSKMRLQKQPKGETRQAKKLIQDRYRSTPTGLSRRSRGVNWMVEQEKIYLPSGPSSAGGARCAVCYAYLDPAFAERSTEMQSQLKECSPFRTQEFYFVGGEKKRLFQIFLGSEPATEIFVIFACRTVTQDR